MSTVHPTSPPSDTAADVEQRGIAVARGLVIDAVERAGSGHTGTALSLAPLAHVLFTRIMRFDPTDPAWPDRDRFVLSAGHASMLQYTFDHLTGQGLEIEDLRQFRQYASLTPGHPETERTPAVEVTTGPLGQGFANSVGLAMAERFLRATFGAEVCDHGTFCIASDGDLMEGVSHEAASLAGHQRLGRLVVIYDDNRITIDGSTDLALSDDAVARFRSYGWHVVELGEIADDLDALEAGVREGIAAEDRPSLLVLRSQIGHPLPTVAGTAKAHGAVTDADELAATRQILGLPADERFFVPADVLAWYRARGARGAVDHDAWRARLDDWDGPRTELDAALDGRAVDLSAVRWPTPEVGDSIATRKASNAVLEALAPQLAGLVVGSADLTGNTGVALDGPAMSADDPAGRAVHFGVREHAMAASMNGMAHHGGVLPVGGTFLVFSDYARPAIRLAALSGAKVIYSFTHDSIGVGEDGPTHQPVEHVAALRAIPGLSVIRPADAHEVAAAWRVALDHDGPTALILTRQGVPVLEGTGDGLVGGAYVLSDDDPPEVVLVGTGSEVQLCVAAAERLRGEGRRVRVVSMPSWDLFEARGEVERATVLPDEVPTVAVEAQVELGWRRWADATVTLDRFGTSAPGEVAMRELGFTTDHVVEVAGQLLARLGR